MQSDEAVAIIESLLPEGSTSELQRHIIAAMWSGTGYAEVAEALNYDHDYVRAVAARMLRQAGAALGCELSKRNFRSVLDARFGTPGDRADEPHFPGGPVPPGSRFYIEPPDLAHARAEIEKEGGMVLVKAPRRRGKSSFLLRLSGYARSSGMGVLTLDLRHFETGVLHDSNSLLNAIAALVGEFAGAAPRNRSWDETIGTKLATFRYLDGEVLPLLDAPLLLVIEGLDQLFDSPATAAEFLPFVRSCYEEARHNPRFARMRWALAYSTELLVPLDLHSSPFNVGLPVRLPELTIDQIARLAACYLPQARQSDMRALTKSLAELTGGHPYLVQVALFHGRSIGGAAWTASVLHEAGIREALFGSHLRAYVALLEDHPRLAAAFAAVASGGAIEPKLAWQLENLGLVRTEGSKSVPACRLYAEHLGQAASS